MKNTCLLLSLSLLLSSCGYHSTTSSTALHTLSIPYVRGDEEGLLTTALIAEMDQMGLYDYVSSSADFELKIALVSDSEEEVIGYRYNRSHHGHIEQNLMETENRRHAAAEITLYKVDDPVPILGPLVVTAFAEFDYIDISSLHELAFTHHGKRAKVIDFSQGQLDSIEGGQDNVRVPLYSVLAKKISRVVWKFLCCG